MAGGVAPACFSESIVEAIADRLDVLGADSFNLWQGCFFAALAKGQGMIDALFVADEERVAIQKVARSRASEFITRARGLVAQRQEQHHHVDE